MKHARTEGSPRDKRPDPNAEQSSCSRTGESKRSREKGKEVAESTSSGRTPSWLQEGFVMPVTQTGLVNLSAKIKKSMSVLTGLSLDYPKIGRFLGDGVIDQCIEANKLKSVASMGVNDALEFFGTHIAQVGF